MNPIHLREIDHLVLRVVDADRMLAFYCDVLGCQVERRLDEIGLTLPLYVAFLVGLVAQPLLMSSIYTSPYRTNTTWLEIYQTAVTDSHLTAWAACLVVVAYVTYLYRRGMLR